MLSPEAVEKHPITGMGGPPYDTWRCRTTVVSYDGPEVSYDGTVVRRTRGVVTTAVSYDGPEVS